MKAVGNANVKEDYQKNNAAVKDECLKGTEKPDDGFTIKFVLQS